MGIRGGWWLALALAASVTAAERDAWEVQEMPVAPMPSALVAGQTGDNTSVWVADVPVALDGAGGEARFSFRIRRYYGTAAERAVQRSRGVLPSHATLLVPGYDNDRLAGEPGMTWRPEFDRIFVNGHFAGTFTGHDNAWNCQLFRIPVEWLNFPLRPGEAAENEVRIVGDAAGSGRWRSGWQWLALYLPAPDPVVLVTGGDLEEGTAEALQGVVRRQLGIPCRVAVLSETAQVEPEAEELGRQVVAWGNALGVNGLQLIAGGRGALEAMRLVAEGSGLAGADAVTRVLLAAPPGAGTPLAEVLSAVKPEWGPMASSVMTEFNRRWGISRCGLYGVTGILGEQASPEWRALASLAGHALAEGDGVVAAASAMAGGIALSPPLPPARADGVETSHGGLLLGGAPRVLRAMHAVLRVHVPCALQEEGSAVPYVSTIGAPVAMLPEVAAAWPVRRLVVTAGEVAEVPVVLWGEGIHTWLVAGMPPEAVSLVGPDGVEMPFGTAPVGAGAVALVTTEGTSVWRLRLDGRGLAQACEVAFAAVGEAGEALALEAWREERIDGDFLLAGAALAGEVFPGGVVRGAVQVGEERHELVFRDDGEDGDETAGDGVWCARMEAEWTGLLQAEVHWETAWRGVPVARTSLVRWEKMERARLQWQGVECVAEERTGRIERLEAVFRAQLPAAGTYRLTAELHGEALLRKVGCLRATSAGEAEFRIALDGARLGATLAEATETELTLRHVELRREWGAGSVRCAVPDPAEIVLGAFGAEEFAGERLRVTGSGVDWNEQRTSEYDRLARTLQVRLDLLVAPGMAGEYQVGATLVDGKGETIAAAVPATVTLADDPEGCVLQPLPLAFPGRQIREAGADGPYVVTGVWLSAEDGTLHWLDGTYTTRSCRAAEFSWDTTMVAFGMDDGLECVAVSEPDGQGVCTAEYRFVHNPGAYASRYKQVACLTGAFAVALDYAENAGDYRLEEGIGTAFYPAYPCQWHTEEVTQQLAETGNGDAILDPGEVITLTVRYTPTPGASAPPRLVLLASALSPLGRQPEDHTPLCHLLDTNRDLCMSDQEVKAGWERWKAGPEVSSRLLLEAITLGRHLRYRYDASKRRFVPAD